MVLTDKDPLTLRLYMVTTITTLKGTEQCRKPVEYNHHQLGGATCAELCTKKHTAVTQKDYLLTGAVRRDSKYIL